MKKPRFPRSILLFTAFYLVAAISAAIAQQNWEFLKIYIPFFGVFAAIIAFMHSRVTFTRIVLGCMSVWGALHLAGGLVRIPDSWAYEGDHQVLYSWWVFGKTIKYDHIVHAFGFGTATWFVWEALRASIQGRLGRKLYPSFGMIILCVFAGMGLGALNELIEFFAVLNIANTNVGGYMNTGWDIVANLVGCLFAGFLILFRG